MTIASTLFSECWHDVRHMGAYVDYQRLYASSIRESDKKLIEILAAVSNGKESLLDIGCSTGNLLRHIRAAFPHMDLHGGDVSELQLSECISDPGLAGIEFGKLDILALPANKFDIITANAVLYMFDPLAFAQCIQSISRALRPGGSLIAFDFFHSFDQEVAIIETSAELPNGHPLHFRSYRSTSDVLTQAGFAEFKFDPFDIPIDLPFAGHDSNKTFTVSSEHKRIQFRGVLAQPWCHLRACKR